MGKMRRRGKRDTTKRGRQERRYAKKKTKNRMPRKGNQDTIDTREESEEKELGEDERQGH